MAPIAWFELGGAHVANVIAFFAERPESGVLRDRYTDGNVGLELLDRFRITLDYPGDRLALAPR